MTKTLGFATALIKPGIKHRKVIIDKNSKGNQAIFFLCKNFQPADR